MHKKEMVVVGGGGGGYGSSSSLLKCVQLLTDKDMCNVMPFSETLSIYSEQINLTSLFFLACVFEDITSTQLMNAEQSD